MNMKALIFFSLIVVTFGQDCTNIGDKCTEAANCRDCIRAHHCCVWCYDETFTGSRCNIESKLKSCDPSRIEHNAKTKFIKTRDKNFTDIQDGAREEKATQLRPTEFQINLRYNEPVNITVQYKPAKNYHLDLYYLMDLTESMKPDLDTLTNLGTQLTQLLRKLTKNHRIAFGSYIDKPEIPFYNTAPKSQENPCYQKAEQCEKVYLFKHKLNFTEDTKMFTSQVGKSGVSANFDELEGGFDALMQIMLCGSKLGWLDNSRKLVLIATEGTMHLAGDGLLAGYTKRNRDLCLMDPDGNYNTSLHHYDYPSLEEIHHVLRQQKINLIIAAKENVYNYYNQMGELLKDNIFVGKLEKTSTNVLKLVEDGYHSFMRRVNLFVNTSTAEELDVQFFADCGGDGNWVKKGTCGNAEEGKEMKFKVQFLLKDYMTGKKTVSIEESNIYENIPVNLNYVGSKCKCPMQKKSSSCNNHGDVSCGDCICHDGWSGLTCSHECKSDVNLCRYKKNGILSLTCSGRGDCICSKCYCDLPYIEGKYCEYECPYDRFTRQKCGGHGICVKGVCHCNEEYIGDDCTCHNSTTNCKAPGSDLFCSRRGICKCNKCNCDVGSSGEYCEYCATCTGLCATYESKVYQHVVEKVPNVENGVVQIELVENLKEDESCVYRYDSQDGKKCDIFFTYRVNEDRNVKIKATREICNSPVTAGFLAMWIVLGFVALAVLIAIIWKARNMHKDKLEYQRFMREQGRSFHDETNPIYKNPIVRYQNPMGTVEIHSKEN